MAKTTEHVCKLLLVNIFLLFAYLTLETELNVIFNSINKREFYARRERISKHNIITRLCCNVR